MKIEELSVGDWVKCNGFKATIAGYNAETGSIQVLTKQKNKMWFGIEAIEPIPLTAEILEKNGLLPPREGLDFDTWWWTNKVDTAIEASEYQGEWQLTIIEQKEIQYNYRLGLGLKYVHELQHALTLAKIDKDIVL